MKLTLLSSPRRLFLAIFVLLYSFSILKFARIDVGLLEGPALVLLVPVLALCLISDLLRRGPLDRMLRSGLLLEAGLLMLLAALFLLSAIIVSSPEDTFRTLLVLSLMMAAYVMFSSLVSDPRFLGQLLALHVAAMCLVVVLSLMSMEGLGRFRLAAEQARPNTLAFMLAFPIPFALAEALVTPRFLKCAAYSMALGILSLGLLLTHSRGALVAVVAGSVVTVCWLFRRIYWKRTMLSMAVLALAVAAMTPSTVWSRLTPWADTSLAASSAYRSLESRRQILMAYADWLSESPFLGKGIGARLEFPFGRRLPHNSFLDVWIGAGLITLLVLIAFLAVHLIGLLNAARAPGMVGYLGRVLTASMVVILVQMQVGDFILGYQFWCALSFHGALLSCVVSPRRVQIWTSAPHGSPTRPVDTASYPPLA